MVMPGLPSVRTIGPIGDYPGVLGIRHGRARNHLPQGFPDRVAAHPYRQAPL